MNRTTVQKFHAGTFHKGKGLMPSIDADMKREGDALYKHYGRPLESGHVGEYVAITSDGQTVLGTSLLDVLDKAVEQFGPGSFIFKVGEKAVGHWR